MICKVHSLSKKFSKANRQKKTDYLWNVEFQLQGNPQEKLLKDVLDLQTVEVICPTLQYLVNLMSMYICSDQ